MTKSRSGEVDAEVWDKLLATPPDEFTKARDELAKDLKQEGRAGAAAAVKAVRKPTMALWAVNALARAEPFVVRIYLDAVELLRKTQLGSAGKRTPLTLRDVIEAERTAQRNVAGALPRALRAAGVEEKPGVVQAALDIVRRAARDDEARKRLAEGRLLEDPGAGMDPFAALFGGGEPVAVAPPAAKAKAKSKPEATPPAPTPAAKPSKADAAAARKQERLRAAEEKRARAAEAKAKQAEEKARRAEERRAAKELERLRAAEAKAVRAAEAAEATARRLREVADAAAARVREAQQKSQ